MAGRTSGAKKAPGARRRKPAASGSPALSRYTPFLIAVATVAAVFGVAAGASHLFDAKPAAIATPVPAPPATPAPLALPAPPKPAAPPPRPAVAEAPAPPPAPAPQPSLTPLVQEVVAMLPAPAPPATPPKPSGTPLWMRNAVPAVMPADKPAIAVVIDDMGLDRKRSARAVQLPGPLTLSWLPYAQDLPAQARAGRAAGHELMLHMPMEPSVKADPGPGALTVGLDRAEVQRRLSKALDSFDGYVGINNHMGSRFTADRAGMAPVLAELQRRGLLWLDSRTTAKTVGPALAQEHNVPHVGRDVFLDDDQSPAAIRAELAKLEAVARRNGSAIAIGHPHDTTLAELTAWLPDVKKRGFVLVPVSAIVRAKHPMPQVAKGERG